MRSTFLLLIIIFLCRTGYCQDDEIKNVGERASSVDELVQLVNGDTLIFYYNDIWQMVRPGCATRFRISRVDTARPGFIGRFIDYYADSTIATKGNYLNGKKEGTFKIYYRNGRLQETGNYSDDHKNGRWDYYYENGNKRQVLDFENGELLIWECWDRTGKKLVDSGNGVWSGFERQEYFVESTGPVVNGERNGIWKRWIPSQKTVLDIEYFTKGKLDSGQSISKAYGIQKYNLDSSLCPVDETSLFTRAEFFEAGICNASIVANMKLKKEKWVSAAYPGGVQLFFIDLRSLLAPPESVRGLVSVKTTIDETGKMTLFVPISNTGLEDDVIVALERMKNWNPATINGKKTTQVKLINVNVF